ncbi:hypothetical protein [uncultured Campylobacter sp.]|nr:hypothetical protein [uncultured Campylobacter sp.]
MKRDEAKQGRRGKTRHGGANKRSVRFAQGAAKFSDIQAKHTKIAPYLA